MIDEISPSSRSDARRRERWLSPTAPRRSTDADPPPDAGPRAGGDGMKKAKVVKQLREHFGPSIDLWYDRSAGSWVFIGECTEEWSSTYSCVYRLSDLTAEQWVETAQVLKN